MPLNGVVDCRRRQVFGQKFVVGDKLTTHAVVQGGSINLFRASWMHWYRRSWILLQLILTTQRPIGGLVHLIAWCDQRAARSNAGHSPHAEEFGLRNHRVQAVSLRLVYHQRGS